MKREGTKKEILGVMRGIFTQPMNEDPQHTSIFFTYITCENKLCKIIVDSGSSMNIISQDVVNRLGLKSIPHPNPYKVS